MDKLMKHLAVAKELVSQAKRNMTNGSLADENHDRERQFLNTAGEYTINADGYPVRQVMVEIPRGDHNELVMVEEVIGPGHPESGHTKPNVNYIPIPILSMAGNGGRATVGAILSQQLTGPATSIILDEYKRSFINEDGSVNSDPDVTAFAHQENDKLTFVAIDNNTGVTTTTSWFGEDGEGSKMVTTSTPDNTDSDGFPMGQSSRPITNETEIFNPDGKRIFSGTSVTTPTGMTIVDPTQTTPIAPKPSSPPPTPTQSDSDGDGWDPSDNDGDFSNSTSNGGGGNSLSNSTEEENEHFEP